MKQQLTAFVLFSLSTGVLAAPVELHCAKPPPEQEYTADFVLNEETGSASFALSHGARSDAHTPVPAAFTPADVRFRWDNVSEWVVDRVTLEAFLVIAGTHHEPYQCKIATAPPGRKF